MTGTALVTGGASGLGEALVSQLLGRGMRVVCVDLHPPNPRDGLLFVKCDLADRRAFDLAWPAILATAPFDIVIFNAGVNATGRFEVIPFDAYRRMMAVNTETPIRMAATMMRESAIRSRGHMVFVSSLSHFTGYPGAAVYAASKDAIAVYAKSVRAAFRRQEVFVTCVYPGPLRTSHAARHAPAGARADRRMSPRDAAQILIAGTLDKKKAIIPGSAAILVALAGSLFRRGHPMDAARDFSQTEPHRILTAELPNWALFPQARLLKARDEKRWHRIVLPYANYWPGLPCRVSHGKDRGFRRADDRTDSVSCYPRISVRFRAVERMARP